MNQTRLLHETDWNNLLILDATRFDVFQETYSPFLRGKLIKAETNSSCTEEWLARNWTEHYDLTYVSGNPYVNSRGVPLRKYGGAGIINGYIAKNHFKRIIDVWKFGWSNKLQTVPPQAMNEAVLKMTDRTNLIVHYVQPHWPYIGKTRFAAGNGHRLRENVEKGLYSKKKLSKLTPQKHRKSKAYMEQNRKAYIDNLKLVLGAVSELVPHLEGKTVVSADHGEFLGEEGFHSHPCFFEHPLLRTVPWLIVEGKT